MQTPSKSELEAMKLPAAERAGLASRLLGSFSAGLSDSDDGVAEAIRRNAELERDPATGLTLEQLRRDLPQ
jgi:putative addiction module component (TIGR02574 family)